MGHMFLFQTHYQILPVSPLQTLCVGSAKEKSARILHPLTLICCSLSCKPYLRFPVNAFYFEQSFPFRLLLAPISLSPLFAKLSHTIGKIVSNVVGLSFSIYSCVFKTSAKSGMTSSSYCKPWVKFFIEGVHLKESISTDSKFLLLR